jgi:hypothetical protein
LRPPAAKLAPASPGSTGEIRDTIHETIAAFGINNLTFGASAAFYPPVADRMPQQYWVPALWAAFLKSQM